MKNLYFILILYCIFFLSISAMNVTIINDTDNLIVGIYERTDEGFLGRDVIVTDQFILEPRESVAICVVSNLLKSTKRFGLVKLIADHVKTMFVPVFEQNEQLTLNRKKDRFIVNVVKDQQIL